MRAAAACLVLSACVATAAGAQTAARSPATWPMFHYSLNHQGVNSYEHKLGRRNVARLRTVWASRVRIGGESGVDNSSVTVSAASVFVGSEDKRVYAFRRSDGKLRWTFRTRGPVESSAAVSNGIVYIGSNDGDLYALRASTGKLLWKRKVGQLVGSSSPTVSRGVVYIASLSSVQGDGALYALNARTGSVLWSADLLSDAAGSSPTIVGNRVYQGNSSGDVLVYPRSCTTSCHPTQVYEAQDGLEMGTPVVARGRVFVSGDGAGGSFVFAFARCSTFACAPLWKGNTLSPYTVATPAVSNGMVYAEGGRLFAFAVECGKGRVTCKPVWKGRAIGLMSSPAVAKGVVYTGSRTGRLFAFSTRCHRSTCKPLYRSAPIKGATPFASSAAVAGGRVYYGAFNRVRAFGLRR